MTLQQVVREGGITNNVQTFIIANLANLFRAGGPYRWPRDINPYPMNSESDMIDTVKGMTNEEVTKLASWLLEVLHAPASYEANPFANISNPQLHPSEWARWVLRKQD